MLYLHAACCINCCIGIHPSWWEDGPQEAVLKEDQYTVQGRHHHADNRKQSKTKTAKRNNSKPNETGPGSEPPPSKVPFKGGLKGPSQGEGARRWEGLEAPLKPPWSPSQAPLKPYFEAPLKPFSSPLQAPLKPPSPWSPLQALLLKPFSSPLKALLKPLEATLNGSQAPQASFKPVEFQTGIFTLACADLVTAKLLVKP